MTKKIELMDTTLRDGEQTSGVAFTATEKLSVARLLLEEVKVDRIEVASARISEGEYEAVENIIKWAKKAGFIDRIEILGFVDGTKSLDWIKNSGAKVINLLCKGSLNHVQKQLGKTPDQHLSDIKESLAYAAKLDISVNVYLEDWSNGMKHSPEYVSFLINGIKDLGVKRFMLPDTLGILNPDSSFEYVSKVRAEFPNIHIDSHLHNDYDMAVGNTYMCIKAGVNGLHTTVNGLGERSGNTPLASVVALKDQMDLEFSVDETKLNRISRIVEAYSGVSVPANKPVVGEYVFTQTCGVHADGDNKGNLYFNELMPERFGRTREYALGKTSGNASIKKNLDELGITLNKEELKLVTERVVELGDKKSAITKEDLPYIISDVLGRASIVEKVKITNYYSTHVYKLKPVSTICIEINGEEFESTSTGDGQYDAFMKALAKIYKGFGRTLPKLDNYKISIPPGGRTDALVETIITWNDGVRQFKTKGLESDQQAAAITATVKMLNLIES
jgi:(R)-citramalate synthase